MYFPRAFLLLGMAMSASAMMTPHLASKLNHRREHAVVARAIADEAAPVPHIPATVVPRRSKRANERRCKAKASSSSSAEAAPTSAVANAGGDVPTFSDVATSSAEPASTKEPATTKAASTEAPATTKAATTKAATTKEATTEAPATTKAAATTKTSSAAAATTAASSSGSGSDLLTATHTGQATFYATGLGACGITNNDGDHIAAVSHLLFDSFPGYNGANPNNNPICNKKVTAHYEGKSTTVTITDRCEGCAMFDLDFSPAAFNELGLPAQGRLSGMTWTFD